MQLKRPTTQMGMVGLHRIIDMSQINHMNNQIIPNRFGERDIDKMYELTNKQNKSVNSSNIDNHNGDILVIEKHKNNIKSREKSRRNSHVQTAAIQTDKPSDIVFQQFQPKANQQIKSNGITFSEQDTNDKKDDPSIMGMQNQSSYVPKDLKHFSMMIRHQNNGELS